MATTFLVILNHFVNPLFTHKLKKLQDPHIEYALEQLTPTLCVHIVSYKHILRIFIFYYYSNSFNFHVMFLSRIWKSLW